VASLGLAAVLAAAGVAACGSATSSSNTTSHSNVITFAEFPGSVPNWIMPITPPSNAGSPNTEEFSFLLWRPLYWTGDGTSPAVDNQLSIADPPTYSNGDRTVTVRLRNYNWSNGKPVTARDVEFWFNLVKYNTADWSDYVAGYIPDNVKTFSIVNAKTFQLTLTKAVSPKWFTADQLSDITPMPQAAWDKTTTSGPVGNYDLTASGAKKVMSYLMAQSKNETTYATNPLWQTVDGPWKLTSFTSTGSITFVPNKHYTGYGKPSVAKFEEIPFTTDTAEFNSLLAGDVDYGYLPFSELSQRGRVASLGYHFSEWNLWTINYIALNYYAETTGAMVNQLYIRQAMESLVNQPLMIKSILHGAGVPNFSPIPSSPANPYATVVANPNPYDPSRAASLLRAHGWTVKPGGATTCTRAGTGASDCGAGISSGTKLAFSLLVNSGNQPVVDEMDSLKSTFSQQAGITLTVKPTPFTTVISDAFVSCTKANPGPCPWQMADWGGGSDLSPYPTGQALFEADGSSDAGHYSNPEATRLITATLSLGQPALNSYQSYMAQQVPEIWVPNLSYQLSMIHNGLVGANAQNPYTAIAPELWHWTK
jgi:peptide/nickel transport system substrate-binding protein